MDHSRLPLKPLPIARWISPTSALGSTTTAASRKSPLACGLANEVEGRHVWDVPGGGEALPDHRGLDQPGSGDALHRLGKCVMVLPYRRPLPEGRHGGGEARGSQPAGALPAGPSGAPRGAP